MSLPHEIGHYLGLHHPWYPVSYKDIRNNSFQCGNMDNGISDLTEFYGNVFADSVMHCQTHAKIYNNNIMSYSDYGVATVFTPGQKQHIRDILEIPAASNGRAELVRSSYECQ
jgi:hypothetical protein